jgi:cell division septation protein DedD
MNPDSEGVPRRQLLLAFFAVVLLCAVFFSLGFFVGYKQRAANIAPVTEQVNTDVPGEANPAEAAPAAQQPGGSAPAGAANPKNAGAFSAEATRGNTAVSGNSPGTAAPGPAPSASSASPSVSKSGALAAPGPIPPGVLVQVAALSNQQDAFNMVDVLKSRGYAALLLTPEQAHARDSFFRVVVGPYPSHAEADKVRSQLAAEGFKPFIRQ